MSNIVTMQKPVLELLVNVGRRKNSPVQWYAASQGISNSVVDASIIATTIQQCGDLGCFYLQRESADSVRQTFKNHHTGKYAHPQSDPSNGNVSVVEGDDPFLWTVTSANDGESGNLISVVSSEDGETYYWGLSANCADGSDIKLRTVSTDLNNHWNFWNA